MPDKHPDFQKIARFIAERDAAHLRAQMAARLHQVAAAKLAKVMTDAGLDPKADYVFDDDAETITVKPEN